MDQDRNRGVTEARFALTLLICLLVAIGYIALLRLGGTSGSTIDVGPDGGIPPLTHNDPPPKVEEQPQVLPVESPDSVSERTPQLAERPEALRGDSAAGSEFPTTPGESTDSQRR